MIRKIISKILLRLFSISCIFGYIFFPFALAVKPPLEEGDDKALSPFTITVDDLKANCSMADTLFVASGRNVAVYSELRTCCELYDVFQMCSPGEIATVSEIDQALGAAVNYFRRTGDKKFINYIMFYITENHINLAGDIGLPLLKSAIVMEDGCDQFVRFLLKNSHVNINGIDKARNTPLHIAVISRKHIMIRILLHYRANFRAVNMEGSTPYQIAEKSASFEPYHAQTVEIFKNYFKKHGVKP